MDYWVWNPSRDAFRLPIFNYPIVWYGLFFALGFLLAYFVMRRLIAFAMTGSSEKPIRAATLFTDKLLWFVVIGTLVGARLAEVFFYDWPYYSQHPGEIIKVWRGGLASHGGVVGVILALLLFYYLFGRKEREIRFLQLLDMLVIPTMIVATCIRIGNFFNQEILGIPTTVPWAVIFAHPAGGLPIAPRHPVQLYEAAFYLATFIILALLYRTDWVRRHLGFTLGTCFSVVFTFRFFIEFIKEKQSALIQEGGELLMGQWLSLPFIATGLGLMAWSLWHYRKRGSQGAVA